MRRRSAGYGCATRGMGAPWKKRPEGASGRRSQHRSVSVTWQCSCSGRLTEWISNYQSGRNTNLCAWPHDPDRYQRGIGVDAALPGGIAVPLRYIPQTVIGSPDSDGARRKILSAQGRSGARSNKNRSAGGTSSPWWNPALHRERRGARLARRDERAYQGICERGATQPAGMDRRSNAAGVSPRAARQVPTDGAGRRRSRSGGPG